MENSVVVNIPKYHKDGAFCEPLLRCDGCTRLIFLTDIKKVGACNHCGNTRVKNVRILSEAEKAQVEQWIVEGKCDQEWLDEFKAVEE